MNIDEFIEKSKQESTHDLLLNIRNSRKVKLKNRSFEVSNKFKFTSIDRNYKTKRQRVFENFI